MNRLQLVTFLTLCVTTVSTASAELIGSSQISGGIGERLLSDRIRVLPLYFQGFPDIDQDAWLFENVFFDESDVGATFTATSENDPAFDLWASYATDGINQRFVLGAGFEGSTGGIGDVLFEDEWFGTGNGTDFTGYVIDRVEFTVVQLDINSPGEDPNGDGLWTDADFVFDFRYYGHTVPAPASLALLGAGALTTRRRIRRR